MASDFPDWGPAIRAGRFILGASRVTVVSVTGTAVPLAGSVAVQQVMLKARTANVGTVYVGPATVTADEAAGTGGLQLAPGDIVSFPVDNLANVFINGTAGDGVSYLAWT